MNKVVSVAHLTSAHPRFDTRIFWKECCSLQQAGFEVSLVVADGLGDEVREGVRIFSVEKQKSRIRRILNATKAVYEKALALDCDIYHLHDPELLPVGVRLAKKGKCVIYDAHEDFSVQLKSKTYGNKFLLRVLSSIAARYEGYAFKRLDAVVTATPTITEKIKRYNSKVVTVHNFPLLNEFASLERSASASSLKSASYCYVGGIGKKRGIIEALTALEHCPENTKLILAGPCSSSALMEEIQNMPQWRRVDFRGFLDRQGVAKVYQDSVAGLVALHPIPNYLDALPVKMFEYMAAGIPVIASNIPLWKNIVESEDCGICVDPYSPKEIGEAVSYLVEHPEKAEEMGTNGRKAVFEKYNWNVEERQLVSLYERLVGESGGQ